MTASEGSFLGLALQPDGKAHPIEDDDKFKYVLFRQGSVAAQNINLPLDPEIGGGAINPRSVVKAGVTSGGMLDLIFRPETMGYFLYGITGTVISTPNTNVTGITAAKATSGSMSLSFPTSGSVSLNIETQLYAFASEDAEDVAVTVVGKDDDGVSVTETFTFSGSTAGSIAGAAGSAKKFKTVTSASMDISPTSGTVSVGYEDGSYTHVFTLGEDQFSAPYYTMRFAPGNMWGEQFQDARIAGLAMQFKGAGFLEGSVQLVGRTPKVIETTTWDALNQIDAGPQFLGSAPGAVMDLPLGTNAKVLSGSFVATSAIPMDEQFIVGAYEPEGLDIVSRSFAVQLNMKIDDGTLYKKMVYDPNGGSEWVASLYREGNFMIKLVTGNTTSTNYNTGAVVRPYSVSITGNGSSGDNGNVTWSASPIALRAQRQVVMSVSGIFHPAPGGTPITITLVNQTSTYTE